jgi:hypothetical protein
MMENIISKFDKQQSMTDRLTNNTHAERKRNVKCEGNRSFIDCVIIIEHQLYVRMCVGTLLNCCGVKLKRYHFGERGGRKKLKFAAGCNNIISLKW